MRTLFELATASPNYLTMQKGDCLIHGLYASAPLHDKSSMALGSNSKHASYDWKPKVLDYHGYPPPNFEKKYLQINGSCI
ncbi:hypothetical protein TNCV_4052271 [Trichonephila clavipes]|nr:hypothetical protein TNCV_4052271 [Trichonephila clavipes]